MRSSSSSYWKIYLELAIFLLLCLGAADALSDEVDVRYGISPEKQGGAKAKMFGLGYSRPIVGTPFRHRLDAGVWADSQDNRSSAGFAFYSLGIRVDTRPIFADSYWGIGGITHTDGRLGGRLQFSQTVRMGLSSGVAKIGLSYSHVSCAGVCTPNLGRDFYTIFWVYQF